MNKIFLFLLVFTYQITIFSQIEIPTRATDDTTYFITVRVMPEPIGGIEELSSKLYYTEVAKKFNIQGKISVLAYINEEGTVDSVMVLQGLGYGLDEIASEAVFQTKFTPGKQDGVNVKVQLVIPIFFRL